MAKISKLPSSESPQQLARKYMLGLLDEKFYTDRPGGLFRLMRMADNTKAVGAAEKALKQLRDLSRIDFEQDGNVDMEVRLAGLDDIIKENTA